MLLSEAYKFIIVDRQIEGFSPLTLKNYKYQVNMLIRHFGDCDLNDVTLESLKEYLVTKGSHLKPSSLGLRIRIIRAIFRWASDEGYCINNPARRLKEPKLGSRVPKALSEEETVLLQEGCISVLEKSLISFMYSSGCRIGEIHKLNRNSINWENRSCIVNGKGDKEREVYFSIKAMIYLKKYLKERKDLDTALFVTERKPYRRTSIAQLRRIIKRVAKRSEVLNNVTPHQLRHSFATHLLNNGAPMEGIQALLGHQKLETTQIYTSLSGSRRKQIHTRYF